MTSYPTKKQILQNKPSINAKIIQETLEWKKNNFKGWRFLSKKEQIRRLNFLIFLIAAIATKHKNLYAENSTEYQYDPQTKTIYHNINHPSIISTLHELGHHIKGKNELKACAWSIHIFETCFPQSYKRLKWKGHMLTK